MKSLSVAILFLVFSSAHAESISCVLKRTTLGAEPNEVSVTVPEVDQESSLSEPLSLGEYNFSFIVEYLVESENVAALNVIFMENNQVQDEVGSIYCEIPASEGTFCQEPINDFDGNKAFEFSCSRQ